MKNFVTILSIVTITNLTQAQTTTFTLSVQTATLNQSTNKWIWEPKTDTRMIITMYPYDVYIDNNSKTKLHIISDGTSKKIDGGEIVIYDALDQNQKSCTWSIVSWNDNSPNQLYLTYPHIMAIYTMSLEKP